jgi:hypothetical protein
MISDLLVTAGAMTALFALIVVTDKIAPQPFYIPTPDGRKQVTEQEWRDSCRGKR